MCNFDSLTLHTTRRFLTQKWFDTLLVRHVTKMMQTQRICKEFWWGKLRQFHKSIVCKLSPWSTYLLENVIVLKLEQKFPEILEPQSSLPLSQKSLCLSWASLLYSKLSQHTSVRYILPLYSYPRLGLPRNFYLSGFPITSL
jgi:hypothetical protein